MNSKSLILLVWFLASTLFADKRIDIPSISEVASKYEGEGFANNPTLKKPTKEDWIQIIEGSLFGESFPRHPSGRNLTLVWNQWGDFFESTGVSGSFNQTVYDHFQEFDTQAQRSLIAVQSTKFAGAHLVSVTLEEQMFSHDPLARNDSYRYISSIAIAGAGFIEINGTLILIQEALGFGQKEDHLRSSDEMGYVEMLYVLLETAEGFSISSQQVQGTMTTEKEKYVFDVFIFENMVPISRLNGESFPEDIGQVAQIFKTDGMSSPPLVVAEGTLKGDITFEGDYNAVSKSFTEVFPDQFSNSTVNVKGIVRRDTYPTEMPSKVRYLGGTNMLRFR